MSVQPSRNTYAALTVVSMAFAVLAGAAQSSRSGMPAQSGWLYVVDATNGATSASILVVDPDTLQVTGSVPTGYRPDIALSRDGTRLYLAHSLPGPGQDTLREVVDIIDTTNGTIVHRIDSQNRWISTLPLYWSQIALSDDGRLLFQMKQQIHDSSYTEYYIATLDLERNVFLPERAAIPMCFTGMMLPQPGHRLRLGVLCSRTEDLRLLTLSDTGAVLNAERVPIAATGSQYRHAGTAFFAPGGRQLTAVMSRGEFLRIDAGAGQVIQRGLIDQTGRRPSDQSGASQSAARPGAHDPNDWLVGRWMRTQPALVSADHQRLVLGIGELEDKRRGHESYRMAAVFDTASLDRVDTIKLSQPAWGMTMSRDGRRLYTFGVGLGEASGTMSVVDVVAGREVTTVPLGTTPTYAVEAP